MSVELDRRGHEGGTLFEWFLDDQHFTSLYNGLGDWLDRVAARVHASSFERVLDVNGPWLGIEDYSGPLTDAPASLATPLRSVYGVQVEFPRDPGTWPPHWRDDTARGSDDPGL